VNHERADHHDSNRAEYRFTQRLITEELADVAANELAKHALHRGIVDATVEHISESRAARKSKADGHEDGRGQPLLS